MRQDPEHTGRSRRQFLRDTALAGVATMSGLVGVSASAEAAPSGSRVAVLGGGVAGLSAALELAERNFRVRSMSARRWAGRRGVSRCRRVRLVGVDRCLASMDFGFSWFLLEPW
jgi:hypothetical protein